MAQEIIIPRLGWSMEEGTFVAWLKSEGDFVKRGDALFELEGEKATQEIEAVDEGVLRIPLTGQNQEACIKLEPSSDILLGQTTPSLRLLILHSKLILKLLMKQIRLLLHHRSGSWQERLEFNYLKSRRPGQGAEFSKKMFTKRNQSFQKMLKSR